MRIYRIAKLVDKQTDPTKSPIHSICSVCEKVVRINDETMQKEWATLQQLTPQEREELSKSLPSHGYCPECLQEAIAQLKNKNIRRPTKPTV